MAKTIENITLNTHETALLREAHVNWENASAFSDEKVAEVKRIFQRVFDEEDAQLLQGSRFDDALVMQPKHNKQMHYAMVATDQEITWIKALTARKNFTLLSSKLPFMDFLHLVGTAEILETEKEISAALLHDCFMLMKRNPSLERLARVASKREDTPTMARLRSELRMLGFDDYSRDKKSSRISAEWVDWDKALRGFAPMTFSIMDCGDYDSDPAGIYIHETHAPSAVQIESWEDWDDWLREIMGI
jgi:hypothetical protein